MKTIKIKLPNNNKTDDIKVKPLAISKKMEYILKLTTCIKICPATIFANNRNERLINLNIYEISSIEIKNQTKKNGIPFGSIVLRKCTDLNENPKVSIENQIIKQNETVVEK